MVMCAVLISTVFIAATPARAGGVDVSIGFLLPFPGYVAPPPVVAVPAPVVVAPPPAIVYQQPVVVAPYPYGYYYRPLPPGHAKRHYRHYRPY